MLPLRFEPERRQCGFGFAPQPLGERAGVLLARERRRLAGPKGRISRPTRASPNRRARARPRRTQAGKAGAASFIGPCSRMKRLTRPRAGRPVKRLVSRVALSLAWRSAARCSGVVNACGVNKYAVPICAARAPSAKGGGHAPSVGDPASRDDWNAHRVDDLRQQRDQARLVGDVLAQEHAAMAASLRPLRDHGVDAARFKPARLGDCRRGGIDLRSRSLHPREERRIRKAEMEAHDRGLRGLDDLRHCGVERRASGAASRSRRIEARLGVGAREALEPSRMLIRIGRGRLVAEEVDVERRRRAGANFCDLVAQDRGE